MSTGRTSLRRVALVWLVVAVTLGGVVIERPPTQAGFTQLHPDDKIVHAPRGDPAGVMRFARAVNSYRIDDTRDYVYEIYRLAPLVGLDPAILIGQSALETGYWRGKFWISDLNPAGIGIYDDNQPTSFHWANGVDAARGHIYHLYVYAAGVPKRGHVLYPYRHLTPGIDGAVQLGFAGTRTTIRSLEGSWALLYLYAWGLCNKANEILGYAEDTAPTATRTPRRTATPTRTSTATKTPTATRTPRAIDGVAASDGNDPRRAIDRDLDTSWAIIGNGTPPPSGQLTFDLGKPINVSTIRWVFRRTGSADYLSIRGSLDGASWTTLKVVGNARAGEWQTLRTAATVRYVRFVFRNPNVDPSLGYLAEVTFNGSPAPRATATPTATKTSTPRPTATSTRTATPSATATGLDATDPTEPAVPAATETVTPSSSTEPLVPTATPSSAPTDIPSTETPPSTAVPDAPTPSPTDSPVPATPSLTPTDTPIPSTASPTPTGTAVPETPTPAH